MVSLHCCRTRTLHNNNNNNKKNMCRRLSAHTLTALICFVLCKERQVVRSATENVRKERKKKKKNKTTIRGEIHKIDFVLIF